MQYNRAGSAYAPHKHRGFNMIKYSIIATLVLMSTVVTFALPKQIIMIRHGEKIDDSHNDLSPQGCQRAYQLPLFFNTYKNDIVAIYAQQSPKAKSSIRPLETIAPTAKMLNIKINNQFLRDDVESVAQDILNNKAYNGKTILVSWEHDAIINLAGALGYSVPKKLKKWPSSTFDQAWIVSYKTLNSNSAVLNIVAEHVLPTDIEAHQSGIGNWCLSVPPVNNGIQVPISVINECNLGNQKLNQIMIDRLMYKLPTK